MHQARSRPQQLQAAPAIDVYAMHPSNLAGLLSDCACLIWHNTRVAWPTHRPAHACRCTSGDARWPTTWTGRGRTSSQRSSTSPRRCGSGSSTGRRGAANEVAPPGRPRRTPHHRVSGHTRTGLCMHFVLGLARTYASCNEGLGANCESAASGWCQQSKKAISVRKQWKC